MWYYMIMSGKWLVVCLHARVCVCVCVRLCIKFPWSVQQEMYTMYSPEDHRANSDNETERERGRDRDRGGQRERQSERERVIYIYI